jgi:hypothetical protein
MELWRLSFENKSRVVPPVMVPSRRRRWWWCWSLGVLYAEFLSFFTQFLSSFDEALFLFFFSLEKLGLGLTGCNTIIFYTPLFTNTTTI